MTGIIPEPLIDYFQRFIEEGRQVSGDRLYRYAMPAESAYWVAYLGFDVKQSEYKKMSTTLFPVFNTVAVSTNRPLLIIFRPSLFDEAKAVAYGRSLDQVTGDVLEMSEYEISVYSRDVDFVHLEHIEYARILRNVEVLEGDYRRAKTLPIFLYGRVYTRYNYTLIPRWLLAKYLAVTLTLSLDYKMQDAFAYAWNYYWDGLHKLAGEPLYTVLITEYEAMHFNTAYSDTRLHHLCRDTFIPENVCYELQPDVEKELKRIYSFVGLEVELEPMAYYPTRKYSIDVDVKWWFADRESLQRDLEFVEKMSTQMPLMRADMDAEAIKEDWWA